jgi:D-3-phosphoglycerate dehydrogenase
MIIAIPDDYHGLVTRLECFRKLSAFDVRVFREAAPPLATMAANLRDADIVVPIRERTRYTRELLAQLPRLKLISQTGRSTRHIDAAACAERGIAIAAGTQASVHTVAEHTWALILSALRRVPEESALMKRGAWRGSFSTALHGRTLGVCGLGDIGALVAATGASFGMKVLAWGREKARARAAAAGYAFAASQDELFERADVLVLMARLTPETRGLVTGAHLARMKKSALLVNTARAELIAPGALVEALRAGRPGSAAVDVYENEPVLRGRHPLLELPNVLCTAHSAWIEQDTYELYFGEAFDNLIAYVAGKPVNLVPHAANGGH